MDIHEENQEEQNNGSTSNNDDGTQESVEKDKGTLPHTATMHINHIGVGILLVLLGLAIIIYYKQRRASV